MMVTYNNGNYTVFLDLDTGTMIRQNDDSKFIPDHPDSMDILLTKQCDIGCRFCHENATEDGVHGDILNNKFIESLPPYTQCAFGGGNVLAHPDIIPFLEKCKELKLIPSITVHQIHFMHNLELLHYLVDNKLIYGLGVSLMYSNEEFINEIKKFKNAVIHIINGVQPLKEIQKLYDKDLKLLILGYKEFRRGKNYYSKNVEDIKSEMYNNLEELKKHFKVVAFDNLALKQLNPARLLDPKSFDTYYMGEDGLFTMYVDLVNNKFATSSTTPEDQRHDLVDDVKEAFKIIREENIHAI